MKLHLALTLSGSLCAFSVCGWAEDAANFVNPIDPSVLPRPLENQTRPEAGDKPATTAPVSEPVARVNGEVVTRAQFDRMLANPLTARQAQHELGSQEHTPEQLERLALRKLIHLRLMVQEAERRGITVSQKELDEAITALRLRFGDLKDFGAWVKEQGLNDPELFETVRTDMLSDRLATALIEGVRVADDQAAEYFNAHAADLVIGEEVRLRIIAVKGKQQASELMAALKQGVPFDHLARRRSVGRLASKGGDTGWVNSRTLPLALRQAADGLKAGEIAEPLDQGDSQFLIVGLQGRRPITATNLAEARPEIERRLLPAAQRAAVDAWLKEQEAKSKVEILLATGRSHEEKRANNLPESPKPSGQTPGHADRPAPHGTQSNYQFESVSRPKS